jgi:Na+/melibiose symporter-like transporter
MQELTTTSRLPLRTKLFYGVGDIGNALVNSAIQFFLMIFYTDTALIPAALGRPGTP